MRKKTGNGSTDEKIKVQNFLECQVTKVKKNTETLIQKN